MRTARLGWRTAVTVAPTPTATGTRGSPASLPSSAHSADRRQADPGSRPRLRTSRHAALKCLPQASTACCLPAGSARLSPLPKSVPQLEETLGLSMVGSISVSIPPEAPPTAWTGSPGGFRAARTAPSKRLASAYDAAFPAFTGRQPGLDVALYNAAEAVVQALEQVDGDLSGDKQLSGSPRRNRAGLPVGWFGRARRAPSGDRRQLAAQYQKNAKGEAQLRLSQQCRERRPDLRRLLQSHWPAPRQGRGDCRHGNRRRGQRATEAGPGGVAAP